MGKRLFLFDLDWTVITTDRAGVRALDYAFAQHYQIQDSMKDISPDGKTDPAIIREMIRAHLGRDVLPGEIESVCRTYIDRLPMEVANAAGYRVLPGIPPLLEALSQQRDTWIGLGTGNLEGGAQAKLSRSGLMPYFKFGGYSSDSENRPDVLRAAVRRGEHLAGGPVAPRDVFVIGDHFRDVAAGQAIGAVTVAVATGHMTVEQLSEHRPDFVFPDLSDTAKVLEALLFHVPQR